MPINIVRSINKLLMREDNYSKTTPMVYSVGAIFIMGRDPVELAKRAKHKPPAMQVRDECYTKNHLSLIM